MKISIEKDILEDWIEHIRDYINALIEYAPLCDVLDPTEYQLPTINDIATGLDIRKQQIEGVLAGYGDLILQDINRQ